MEARSEQIKHLDLSIGVVASLVYNMFAEKGKTKTPAEIMGYKEQRRPLTPEEQQLQARINKAKFKLMSKL
ncbi:hypothetical protein D6827_01180 [Candidatus Parcubacteria bacterium]|nr:MAG: hypothetical protein D6827_01180 [Candidatus Parcubacteria bacterium]